MRFPCEKYARGDLGGQQLKTLRSLVIQELG